MINIFKNGTCVFRTRNLGLYSLFLYQLDYICIKFAKVDSLNLVYTSTFFWTPLFYPLFFLPPFFLPPLFFNPNFFVPPTFFTHIFVKK